MQLVKTAPRRVRELYLLKTLNPKLKVSDKEIFQMASLENSTQHLKKK